MISNCSCPIDHVYHIVERRSTEIFVLTHETFDASSRENEDDQGGK